MAPHNVSDKKSKLWESHVSNHFGSMYISGQINVPKQWHPTVSQTGAIPLAHNYLYTKLKAEVVKPLSALRSHKAYIMHGYF